MMESQKIIKNVAMIVAIILAFNIVASICYGIVTLSGVLNDSDTEHISDVFDTTNVKVKPSNLRIDVSSVNLSIKEGEEFKVETNSNHIKVKETSNQLYIKEENHKLIKTRVNAEVTVYVPNGYIFDDVSIDNGAGKVNFETLSTKNFLLDVGAGKVNIDYLTVSNEAKINSGAGKTVIHNTTIHNLDLDVGVGAVTLNAKLVGKNEIDAGVGSLEINLLGSLDDYKIKVDKGIGTCKIDGNSVADNTFYGTGDNIIVIDGGVGSIHVNFEKSINNSTTFTKTYTVLNKTASNEENRYYVTLQVFQGEVDTVLIEDKDNILDVDGTYEFTFVKNNKIEDRIESIFSNSELIDIKKTDKKGLEQIQEKIS